MATCNIKECAAAINRGPPKFWLIYKTHARGFIGLQIHGLSQREVDLPANAGSALTTSQPLVIKWRNIRIKPLPR